MTSPRRTAALALLLLLLAACGTDASPPLPDVPATAGQAATPSLSSGSANDALLGATSPFEDLAEFARAGDLAGMDRAIAAYRQQLGPARAALDADARDRLESLTTAIETARARDDRSAAAPTPRAEAAISKVASVTLAFWVMKILATTLGKTAGDFLTDNLGLSYVQGALVTAGVIVVVLALHYLTRLDEALESIRVLIRPALPWAVGVAEVDLDPGVHS